MGGSALLPRDTGIPLNPGPSPIAPTDSRRVLLQATSSSANQSESQAVKVWVCVTVCLTAHSFSAAGCEVFIAPIAAGEQLQWHS